MGEHIVAKDGTKKCFMLEQGLLLSPSPADQWSSQPAGCAATLKRVF